MKSLDMLFYKEEDGNIMRNYRVQTICDSIESAKSKIEIVTTEEFGNALFLDNQLQMTEKDEYIYHEMLIHPAMSLYRTPISVCILGGGDGCAVRELLKWSTAETIDIYDWDQDLVALYKHRHSHWNSQSLQASSVTVKIDNVLNIPDTSLYDIFFVDLVDPDYTNQESKTLWQSLLPKLANLLKPNGTLVLNVGGLYPWKSSNVEWILMLIASAFSKNETHELLAYKVFVPSFAREWCFFMIKPIGSLLSLSLFDVVPSIRYFDRTAWQQATTWTKDASPMIPKIAVKLKGYLPPL